MKKIKRALISVSNKDNLKKILSTISKYKIELISSGGTFKKIKKLKFNCTEVSAYTGFQEILSGRVLILRISNLIGLHNSKKKRKLHKTFIEIFLDNIKKNKIFDHKNIYKDFLPINLFAKIVFLLIKTLHFFTRCTTQSILSN